MIEVIFNEDGTIANFEEILANSAWVDSPGECSCECHSYRIARAILKAEDAVWRRDHQHDYDFDKKEWIENTHRKYHKYHGEIELVQQAYCRFNLHNLYLQQTKNSILDEESDDPIIARPYVCRGVKTPYCRDPHAEKTYEYQDDARNFLNPVEVK